MIASPAPTPFSLDDFVARQEQKNLLRFIVCGSVDHGKSTLIGRLLFEAEAPLRRPARIARQGIAQSRHAGAATSTSRWSSMGSLPSASRKSRSMSPIASLRPTRRKFIVADAPGHEQYTRNMATGASTADLALLVVSAESGLTQQTKRHLLIVTSLGVRQIVVAVNKMDLVGWSQSKFAMLEGELHGFATDLEFDEIAVIPVAAASGDNVVSRSGHMPWYRGPSLLEHLEQVEIAPKPQGGAFRMPVQWVNRSDPGFRGYSGSIAGGEVHPDMPVQILPSGQWARIERIVTADGDLDRAVAGQAVTLTLAGEIDASRGDVIAEIGVPAPVTDRLRARLVWMGEEPLTPGKPYLLKLAACTATVTVEPGLRVFDLDTRELSLSDQLPINSIGTGVLEVDRRIAVDRYADNKETGGFILIDPESNDTVGMGMVDEVLHVDRRKSAGIGTAIAGLIRSTESHARSIAKAASWRMTGSFDTFIIAVFITGSPKAAGAVPLTEVLTKTALYYFHERIWILIPWGKRPSSRLAAPPDPPAHVSTN